MNAAPTRKRPGSQSPIALIPKVEPVNTPATPTPATVAPTPAPPAAPAQEPAPAPSRTEPAAPTKERRSTSTKQDRAPSLQEAADDPKVSRTFMIRLSQIKAAETAVLRTGGLPGGYKSMTALMNAALARELERLAAEFNDGDPFPPNAAEFRVGRPLG